MTRSLRTTLAAAGLAVASALLVAGCDVQQAAPPEAVATTEAAALTGPACTATGAHVAHSRHACTTCHTIGGSLCFDPAGPAQAPGKPAPSFDFTTKTCSNVACHGMYEGVYEYSTWDWGCECSIPRSVPYAGAGGTTPSWYTTGLGCAACHANPPYAPGTTSRYHWHTTAHGVPHSPSATQCATCHPGTAGNNATGGTSDDQTLHANGVINVSPRWTSGCFNCH